MAEQTAKGEGNKGPDTRRPTPCEAEATENIWAKFDEHYEIRKKAFGDGFVAGWLAREKADR